MRLIFLATVLITLPFFLPAQTITVSGKVLDKEDWDKLAEQNKAELPPLLANTMIRYSKTNNLSKKISIKWGTSKRNIENNLMQMARYISLLALSKDVPGMIINR